MNCSDCGSAFRAWHRTSGNLERATFMCGRDADGPPTVLCLSRQLATLQEKLHNTEVQRDYFENRLKSQDAENDEEDWNMNCPKCGDIIRSSGLCWCLQETKLADVTAQRDAALHAAAEMEFERDRAREACRALTKPLYTTAEAYAMCEAVVAEADKEKNHD